jgi:hypothetical protein
MPGGGGGSTSSSGGNDLQVSGAEAAYSNEKGGSTWTHKINMNLIVNNNGPDPVGSSMIHQKGKQSG